MTDPICNQDPYLPTYLKNVLSRVPQIYLNLEAFESNTISEWPNNTNIFRCGKIRLAHAGNVGTLS